ncbi:hypothetical protein NL676_002001 [Syzygium grande]|nr:hypothetical protein NL676_002001 [Syzygium grande]
MNAQEGSGSAQSDASMPSSPAETHQSIHGDGPEGNFDVNEGRSSSPAAHEETKNDEEVSVPLQALADYSLCLDGSNEEGKEEDKGMNGRERLKRHRVEVAGQAWIPEIWGQEELLKDWVDCSAFEASFLAAKITSAKAALVEEGRRANSGGLSIENRDTFREMQEK